MGIKATVVYDIPRHTTLVLRTPGATIAERYEVIDTIASFSNHCESLRGVAQSVTEVSAEWGGPPYVTYNVVYQRFRVIVVWDESPTEFDLAHDVELCLNQLEDAVVSVQQALVDRNTDALAKVYDEAGYALRGDVPIVLPSPGQAAKKTSHRSKLLPTKPPLGLRRSSNAEPRKKKSTVTGGRLFGKIGSALRNVTSGTSTEPPDAIINSQKPKQTSQGSDSSLRAPSEGAAMSVAMYGSESGFDDELGELELPYEVFAWASFGEVSPSRPEDLKWFEDIIKGSSDSNAIPRKPLLRHSSTPSTPLTISSSATPIAKGTASVPSSVVDSRQEHDLTTTASAAKSPSTSLQSPGGINPEVASRPLSSPTNAAPQPGAVPTSRSRPEASGLTSVQAGETLAMYGGEMPRGQTQRTANVLNYQNPVSAKANHQPHTQAGANVPHLSTQHTSQVGASARIPTAVPSQAPSFILPTATGHLSTSPPSAPQSAASRASLQSTPGPQNATKPSATGLIPPALASQEQDTNDFDVAHLGDMKDESASTLPPTSTGSGMGASVSAGTASKIDQDEAIRDRMNEFAMTMQAGNFTLALQQVYATLTMLRGIQPRRDRETVTCSNYVLAQKILIRNGVLETELTRLRGGTPESVRRHIEMALLTMFLAELKHVLPRHRVAAMKVAIEKNIVVGNFGMCARWLRYLLERAPPAQKAELSQRLEHCVRNGERNAQMPPTNRLCYITLQVLNSPYGKCTVCDAVYHPQMAGVVSGQICPTCFVGAIQERRA